MGTPTEGRELHWNTLMVTPIIICRYLWTIKIQIQIQIVYCSPKITEVQQVATHITFCADEQLGTD